MNKQELIEELECIEVSTDSLDYLRGADYANERAISLAKQLDEPKKVIFSHEEKFVADWLDGLRGQISNVKLNSGAVFMTFIGRQLERYYDEEYSFLTEKIESWLTVPKNKVKLMSAIDNGYEVEKEPLYHVLLSDKGATNIGYTFLNLAGTIDFTICKEKVDTLTENQIKAIDERYWPFAVKVDGE
ncbi:DUF1642 domain-containing protein [Enterococcus faecalis]|jgi:hypothetical protein|uniref:DUF1642 domain-containing protein n=1 Tax=Enterococcus faecalis TaxID=1351 RepID=UPI0006686587|nr:DUF1642 domain-containing protein [Enterococcus faecalis]MDK8554798.1 DUF1642 domain-containing protein [Enterococcus faecalis]MXS33665.1 DUF1642 domain-containing protein [Enterococcus faecalis]NSP11655.1 DUF1642 domain-containing protein [Enterococcus faecalis]NSR00556.1 DUF1642 domain-containing protein [Enterococcus faecalis]NSU13448.1 DUF1642 domain-containing protein [Enterococcus faecalis]